MPDPRIRLPRTPRGRGGVTPSSAFSLSALQAKSKNRRSQNALLGQMVRSNLQEDAPKPNASDAQILQLLRFDSSPEMAELLGMPADTNLSEMMQSRALMRQLGPDVRARAASIQAAIQRDPEYGAILPPQRVGLPNPVDEQLSVPRPTPMKSLDPTFTGIRSEGAVPTATPTAAATGLSNAQRASQFLARQGYAPSELGIPNVMAPRGAKFGVPTPDLTLDGQKANIGFKEAALQGLRAGGRLAGAIGDIHIPGVKMPPPEAFQKDFGGKTVEELSQQPREFVTAKTVGTDLISTLDIFSETVAEIGAQIPKLVRGNISDIEAPILFTQGPEAALRKFEARPIKEQVLLSLLDPTIIFGGGRFGTSVLRSSFKLIKRGGFDISTEAGQQAAMEAAKLVPAIIRSQMLLNRVQPQGIGRAVPGSVRRLFDPSSEILQLPVGSPKRIALEGKFILDNSKEMGQAFTEIILANVKSKGDVHKLFGVPRKVSKGEPRTKGIFARNADDQADVSSSTEKAVDNPFFGNVFERPGDYILTPEQRKWIDDVHEILDEALRYWKSEGVNVEELGKLDDAFYFFPRRIRDERTRKLNTQMDFAPGKGKVGKHRTRDFMEDTMRERGLQYDGPIDVLAAYFRAGYDDVARIRAEKHVGQLARSQKVDPAVILASQTAKHAKDRLKDAVLNIGRMKRGFIPSRSTLRAMKRALPDLAERIDVVMKLKPTEINELVSRVSKDILDAVNITPSRFRQALNDVSGPSGFKTSGRLAVNESEDVAGFSVQKTAQRDNNHVTYELIGPDKSWEITIRKTAERNTAEFTIIDLKVGQTFTAQDAFSSTEIRELGRFLAKELPGIDNLGGLRVTDGHRINRANISLKRFRNRAGLTEGGSSLDKGLVQDAVAKLKLDNKEAAYLIKETIKQTENLFKGARGAEIDALLARAKQFEPIAQSAKDSAKRAVKRATDAAGEVGPLEGRAESLSPNLIFDKAVADDLERLFHDVGTGFGAGITTITSVIRGLKTTLDFGAPFIQGLPVLARDPEVWARATANHYRAFLDKGVRTRYIHKNSKEIIEMIKHGGQLGSSEFTEALGEGGWFAKLPFQISNSGLPLGPARGVATGGANIVSMVGGRFSNSFETFLDLARVEMWKGLRPLAKTPKELDELATFVNKLTGTTSSKALGVSLGQRQIESALLLFSPRYTRAMAGLILDMFRGSSLRGEQARKSVVNLLMAVGAVHVAGAVALGQDIHLDPSKPGEFLKWEIGGQRVGPGSKIITMVKLLGRISRTTVENPKGFLSWNVLSAETYAENPLLSTLRNQSSPFVTSGLSLITGADPIGNIVPGTEDPIDILKHLGTELFPFWLDAMIEGSPQGALSSVIGGATEFAGGTSFSVPAFSIEKDLMEKYAQEDLSMSVDEINQELTAKQIKQSLRDAHPDLAQARVDSELEQKGKKNQQSRIEYRRQTDEVNQKWVKETQRIGENFLSSAEGSRTPDKFREAYRTIGAVKRASHGAIRKDPQFVDIIEDFEEFGAEQAEEAPKFAAQQEFFDRIQSEEVVDITGKVNYIALNEVRADIDAKYGDGMMAQLDKAQDTRRQTIKGGEVHPVVQAYVTSFKTLQPYWEAYKTVLPEESWTEWELFDAQNDLDQDVLGRLRPDLRRMATQVARERLNIQRDNIEIDRALMQFFGRRPRNRELIRELRRGLDK